MIESFRILIVEDEHIVALDLQDQVEKLGHSVLGIARTGERAIELALGTKPDLILMDIRLNGNMDGITAATQIRSVFPIPIVYLTAYTDAQTLERASITQPLGYILKPFQLRELETTIQLALYKSKVEAELDQYTRQLDSIMRHATDGFVLIDSQAKILRMNSKAKTYLRLLDHNLDEPLQKLGHIPVDNLLSDHDASSKWVVSAAEPSDHVFEITVSDEFTSDTTYNPNHSDNTARLFVIRDITLQQQMQKENEENARMAAIGQLAAGIAHDFNNILAVILTKTDIIRMTESDFSIRSQDNLSVIREQVKRATELISQVLDFSRSSNLDMSSLNVYPLINEHVKLIRRTFPERINIEFQHAGTDFWITGDPTRISQAVMNLTIRARDAMVEGGNLSLSMFMVGYDQIADLVNDADYTGDWVCIQIDDTGEPLKDEYLPGLFDPLIAPEKDQRGLSMQLAQTKGIAEQHNGTVVVSTEANGNSFRILLPGMLNSETVPSDTVQIVGETSHNDRCTVLLVEDDKSLRESIDETLKLLGYSVFTAQDGADGLLMYHQNVNVIDVVLTDMIMPKMDGMSLCREIRKESADVKLIILSGYSSHAYADMDEINIAAVLTKPVEVELLDKTLSDVIHNS